MTALYEAKEPSNEPAPRSCRIHARGSENEPKRVYSINEWDRLEEVIVGRADHACLASWSAAFRHLPCRERVLEIERLLPLLERSYAEPRVVAANAALERLAAILTAEGVTVQRPDVVDWRKGYSSMLWTSACGYSAANPRDVFMVIGDMILETPMAARDRYFESWAYKRLLNEYSRAGARWVSAPKPRLDTSLFSDGPTQDGHPFGLMEDEPVFDAADFVRCGKDIVGQLSWVTNQSGVDWLQTFLGREYRVHLVRSVDPDAYHIDTTLVPLCEGVALVNPNYLDLQQLPDFLKTWDLLISPDMVPYPKGQRGYVSDWIGMNVLSLDSERVLVDLSSGDNAMLGMYELSPLESGIISYPDERGIEQKYDVGRFSNRAVKEFLMQSALFNLTDGAWLQHIHPAGPWDVVRSKLFSIWDDECGNGNYEQNHSNIYRDLLHSLGIHLPPIQSRELIAQDFLDEAFKQPVFEQCVSHFPGRFLPEILGMTLFLEWEATPVFNPIMRLLEARQYNSLYYSLHVAIDNISAGHGAVAKDAVKLYMAEQRARGSAAAAQEQWRRIWNGYVTWATMDDFSAPIVERYLAIDKKQINVSADPRKPKYFPDIDAFYHRQMVRLICRKASVASRVHRGRTLAGKPLSGLFAEPEELMRLMVKEGLVDPDHPRGSRFIQLAAFEGPMYKVFTQAEIDVVLDWIESLKRPSYSAFDPMPKAAQ